MKGVVELLEISPDQLCSNDLGGKQVTVIYFIHPCRESVGKHVYDNTTAGEKVSMSKDTLCVASGDSQPLTLRINGQLLCHSVFVAIIIRYLKYK